MPVTDPFFSIPENREWNACIGRQGDEENYADGYMEAAIELASAVIDKKMYEKRDTLVLPILYNARHAIELTLKLVIRVFVKCGIMEDGHKTDHDIASHLKLLDEKVIPDEAFKKLLATLKPYVDSLDQIDKDGQELRYHTDRDGKMSLDQKALANIEVIRHSLSLLATNLKSIKYRSYSLDEEWATGTWTKQCSRTDLCHVAKLMPKRSNWDSEDFTRAKDEIQKRFNFSNKQFSEALDKIQSARELAGIIGVSSDLLHLTDEKIDLLLKKWREFHPPKENRDAGIDFFDRQQWMPTEQEREREAKLISEVLEEFSEDEIADAETIYYLCRDRVFPEFYEKNLARKKREFQANGNLRQEVYDLMCKTNFEQCFRGGVLMLGRLDFAQKI